MSPSYRLTQCLGLGQADASQGLVCDPQTGRYELAEAVNVEVRHGRVRRRPGLIRLGEAGYESLFAAGQVLCGVRGSGLYAVSPDGGERLLRGDLTPGAPMATVTVGEALYFANGFETGLIRDGLAIPWGGGTYPGFDRTGRFIPPPAGQVLAFFAGRIWIGQGNLVRFTEGAGLLDWVDGAFGFLAPVTGRVRLLRPVGDGLLIGDDAGVLFAAGDDPKTMRLRRVCPTPPLPGSDVGLDPGRHGQVAGRNMSGPAALFACRDGIYLGETGGTVTRLRPGNIPDAGRATAVATRDRYLLFVS